MSHGRSARGWRRLAFRTGRHSPASPAVALAGDLAAASLPPADAPREVQQQAIQRLAERLNADLALFDSAQRLIAAAGNPLPPPSHWHGMEGGGWIHGLNLHLPDQRWLVVRPPALRQHPALHLILLLGGIVLVVAVCAYPLCVA